MNSISIFIDGSLSPQKKIGYGAYLLLNEELVYDEKLKKNVILKRFENTSSTKLEIETFLWCIKEIDKKDIKIDIYTDCQNLVELQSRQERLEKNNYHSSKGKLLSNSELYKEFFLLIKKYNCNFIKVKGHKKNSLKDEIDKIFNIVDKASREALRNDLVKQG